MSHPTQPPVSTAPQTLPQRPAFVPWPPLLWRLWLLLVIVTALITWYQHPALLMGERLFLSVLWAYLVGITGVLLVTWLEARVMARGG